MNRKEIKKLSKAIILIAEVKNEIKTQKYIEILRTNKEMIKELEIQVQKIKELEQEISELKTTSIIENLKTYSGKVIANAYELTTGRISQIKKEFKIRKP